MMTPTRIVPQIIQHPFAVLMQGARLDTLEIDRNEIRLGVQGLEIIKSELFKNNDLIMEQVIARHVPLKLTFSGVSHLKHSDFFMNLEQYALDDPARTMVFMYSWRQPGMEDIFYLFGMHGLVDANLSFFASDVAYEQEDGGKPFTFDRDYSPSPPMPDREVPQPYDIYDRFGGDPVKIKLNGNEIEDRLFIGGIENQPENRPEIDAVLNIGEKPSAWIKDGTTHPNDRTVEKGEGLKGMSPDEIREEANWVIDRLQKDESVLVHCVAGMNRSTTICCAVLMQLEGLSAEAALERVQEYHPWAKPDSHHWLALRWLENNKKE